MDTYNQIMNQFPKAERRHSQEKMIQMAASAFEEGRSLVVEAGTGSGKSFGYLIPALLQQKRPVVVSTATIALQEQLVNKDIPFLAEAMGLKNLNVKLVKGRGNYICIQKLLEAETQVKPTGPEILHLNYLKSELADGWNGDMGELDMAVPSTIWGEVRSETDDCLGAKCKFYQENPYRMAREDLDKADIIVTNHALYFQDVMAGNTLLPAHDIVIFDEAHQLKTYGLNAFTARIGRYATNKLLQKIHRRVRPVPEALVDLIQDADAALLDWLFRNKQQVFRLQPDEFLENMVNRHLYGLKEIEGWLASVTPRDLELVKDRDIDELTTKKNNLVQQLKNLIARWEFFLESSMNQGNRVNWVELNFNKLYYELKSTPLTISTELRDNLWPEKSALLTSATLSVNNSLSYVKSELGLDVAEEAILPSPFNYNNQAVLYLPQGMPDPNTDDFARMISEEVESLLNKSEGRALVLFTSYSNMQHVSDAVIPRVKYPCKVQGELPRHKLIDWFKETEHPVIFATATFWEGVDIPGDSLTSVIMDKIPFASPNDPVSQAWIEHLKKQGADWFTGYMLPSAVIRLKQGFGRLIRSSSDKGIVSILDPRLQTKGYGRTIIRSLPSVPVVYQQDEIPTHCLNLSEEVIPQQQSSV